MGSESSHDDAAETATSAAATSAGVPDQRNAQPSEAADAFLPKQSDGGSAIPAETPDIPEITPKAEDSGLSERDRAVLVFEKQHWKYAGSKEQAIRDRFGMSATRYYQVLNALLDRPEALEFEPMVVNRLRRRRAVRQRARSTHPRA